MANNLEEELTVMELNEYKMTALEYKEIANLSEGNNSGEIPNSILLDFWKKLGEKYGFKWETGQACTKGGRYFLAVPSLPNSPQEIDPVFDYLQN